MKVNISIIWIHTFAKRLIDAKLIKLYLITIDIQYLP